MTKFTWLQRHSQFGVIYELRLTSFNFAKAAFMHTIYIHNSHVQKLQLQLYLLEHNNFTLSVEIKRSNSC